MAPRKNHYKKLQELERQIDEYEDYSSLGLPKIILKTS